MRLNPFVLVGTLGLVAATMAPHASATPVLPPTDKAVPVAIEHASVELCPPAAPGYMRCHARRAIDVPFGAGPPPGSFGAPDLVSAYGAVTTGGTGVTVALIDAFDNPNAANDVNAYRAYYGIPPLNAGGPTFTKVNQQGQQGPYPVPNANWGGEEDLDIEMVSAVCPLCNIVLIEVDSNLGNNLDTGEATAKSLGATVASNSWGGPEYSGEAGDSDTYFNIPGLLIFASSGDTPYASGPTFPASSQYLLAVGGTTLVKTASGRGWAESAWAFGSSGCSGQIAKPAWQTDTGCSMRTYADVSAVASNVAVYDGAWTVYSGTSVSSPLVAGIYASSGKAGATPQFVYQSPTNYNDVTQGSNGSCGGSYLCTAGVGFDGPTGFGTPDGMAFSCATSATCPKTAPICVPPTCRACMAADCTAPTPFCKTSGLNNGACVECLDNTACSGSTPICGADGACRACVAADCSGATPVCATSGAKSGACVVCSGSNSSKCTGTTPFCDLTNDVCRACTSDQECAGVCLMTGPMAGACVQCTAANTTQCNGSAPVCDVPTNTCRACKADAECPKGDVCDTSTDSLAGACVACNTSAQCPSGKCDPTTHTCSGGTDGGAADASPPVDSGNLVDASGGDGGSSAAPPSSSGCGCTVVRPRSDWTACLLGLALGLLLARRRR